MWMQAMCIHNLTQAQVTGSYARWIQSLSSLASKARVPGKRGAFAMGCRRSSLMENYFMFCLKFNFFE